ncbi:MAG TPA: hypothetical protein VJ922_08135 [Actinomycetota bacterium]|nr:hypothetical protein [Actinomycetota bacterium]
MRAIPIDSFFEDLEGKRPIKPEEAVSDASFDWGRIVAEGLAARAAADGGSWRIGHLALLVERRYASGALQKFSEAIGESYGTVRRYRWVARAFDPDIRLRFPGLSFSHFQAVAGLSDRLTWLQRASRGSWSVDRLTRESRSEVASKPARTSKRDLTRLRSSIEGLKRSLPTAAALDDAAIAGEGKGWLVEALDDLLVEIERLRERVRRATRAAENRRPLKVARERSVASPKPKTPTALKARAIGR